MSTVFNSNVELVVSSTAALGLGFWLSANGVPSGFLSVETSLRIVDFFSGLPLASASSSSSFFLSAKAYSSVFFNYSST
jgi:hypothetical protein